MQTNQLPVMSNQNQQVTYAVLHLTSTHLEVERATEAAEQALATLSPQQQDQLFQRMWSATAQAADAVRGEAAGAASVVETQDGPRQPLLEVILALGKLLAGSAYQAASKVDGLVRHAPRAEFSRLTLGASSAPSEQAELNIKFANGIVCRPDMALPREPGAKPLGWLLKCPGDGQVPDGLGGVRDARSCEWRLVFRCGDQWIDGPVIGPFDANGEIEVPFADSTVFSVDLVPVAVEPVGASE